LVIGAAVSGLGALMLDEFVFSGMTPFVAGALLGLVVSEFVIEVGASRSPTIGALTGLSVALAMLWVVANAVHAGAHPSLAVAWTAIILGGAIAGVRTSGWMAGSRDRDVTAPG
jgi:hypothetical protein